MGPTTMRNDPRWTGSAALVVASAMGLASGCGSTTSLDLGAPPSTGTSTTDASNPGTPTSADASTTTGSGTPSDVPVDVPADLPDLPLPGSCPAACEVELPLVWSWEDEPLLEPPPDPLDPTDTQGRRLSAMTWAPDGTLLVADRRSGEPWLTRTTRDGALIWSLPFHFDCECEIVELGFSTSGQLVVLGEGLADWGSTWFELSSYFLSSDDIDFLWRQGAPLYGSPERPGRVGSLAALDDDFIAVLVVQTGLDGDVIEKDWYEVRSFAAGSAQDLWQVDTQLATAAPRRPRGIALPRGEMAMSVQGSVGQGDYVVWARGWYDVGAASELAGPVDAMAAGLEASIVTAGIDRTAPRGPVLHVASLPHEEPPAWIHALDVPAPGVGAPALAMDGAGNAYVAVRTTTDASDDDAALMLMRFAPDGTPVWTTSLPLPVSEAPIPVALSLADDDDQDLVLAAIVDGRLHLERREQGCRCD